MTRYNDDEWELVEGEDDAEWELGDDDDGEWEVAEEPPFLERLKGRSWKIPAAVAGLAALITLVVIFGGDIGKAPGRPGTQMLDDLVALGQEPKPRFMYVLSEIAKDNMPSSSKELVTIEVKGRKGTVVKFKVQPHGLRIGTDENYAEVPTDGPHSRAACEIQGLTLQNHWMADHTRKQAMASGGMVQFIAYCEIGKPLGVNCPQNQGALLPWRREAQDGVKQMSPEFDRQRNILLKEWRAANGIEDTQLTSGYFKEVIYEARQAKAKRLATYPGCGGIITAGATSVSCASLVAANHGRIYHDYSHLARCAEPVFEVNGDEMGWNEFFGSKELFSEFHFDLPPTPDQAYPYYPELRKFVEKYKE